MTTREEMALAFAQVLAAKMLDAAKEKILSREDAEIGPQMIMRDAVEMADLLIEELQNKKPNMEPPVR